MRERPCRQSSQDVCPSNRRFAAELPDESPYAAREALLEMGPLPSALGPRPLKDARSLAREILGMTQEEFSRAFSGSPMKRAKLRGLKRNAAVVLGNVGTSEDADVLTRVLGDEEPLVREQAAWALARVERR